MPLLRLRILGKRAGINPNGGQKVKVKFPILMDWTRNQDHEISTKKPWEGLICVGKVHSLIHMFDVQTGCLCLYKCLSASWSSKSVTRKTWRSYVQFVKHLIGAKKLPGVSSSSPLGVKAMVFDLPLGWRHHKVPPATKVPQLVHETSSQSAVRPAPHPPGRLEEGHPPKAQHFSWKPW